MSDIKKRTHEEEESPYQKFTKKARHSFREQLKEALEVSQMVSKAERLLIGKSDVDRKNRVSRELVIRLDDKWDDDRLELLVDALNNDTGPFGIWFKEQFGPLAFGTGNGEPLWEECMPELFVLACEHMTLTPQVSAAIFDLVRAFDYVPKENSDGEQEESSIDLSEPIERLIDVLGSDRYFETKACGKCGRCGTQMHVKVCPKEVNNKNDD